MNFLADMTVRDFLLLHSKCRVRSGTIGKYSYHANALTGEPINEDMNLTVLSGGQSRSLMVADVAFIKRFSHCVD
jgi:ABC-type lipoprotein export system ATPase subunit